MDTQTPGLRWRKRAGGKRQPYWIARDDLVKKGFTPKTVAIHFDESLPDYQKLVADRCYFLQQQMLEWSRGAEQDVFRGKLHDLIDLYQGDLESPFHGLRAATRRSYADDLRTLDRERGTIRLADITGRDLRRWHAEFKAPRIEGGPERLRRAHGIMTMLRIILNYGVVLELPECERLAQILSKLKFPSAPARTGRLTAAHAAAICKTAREKGMLSVALAQAFQFELTLRQKDVIGEWVPIDDPGLSDITDRRQKWMRGLRWEEIDGTGILTHTTSKRGQVVSFEIARYPMIVEQIAAVPADQRSGPIIVCESTGLPYRKRHFADVWRAIATAAGVPADVWNMDSRAGGVTEATDADSSGSNLEAVRHHAGHRNIATTQRYSRATLEKNNKVADIRSAHRAKPTE